MEPLETQLTDRNGNDHSYMIVPIKPSRSMDIAGEVLAAISRPGLRLVRLGMAADGGEDRDMAEIMASVDFSQLGEDVESTIRSLSKNPDLVKRLFHTTLRDGKPLDNDLNFDNAYAGNWGELYAALAAIVRHNGLIPFLDMLGND